MTARFLRGFDPLLLLSTIALLVISILAVRVSIAPTLASRQIIFICIGVVVMIAVAQVDVLRMRELKYGHFGLVIVGLILILFLGA
ncbi:MAG: hypothetical protein Q7T55_11715, partial [Solirubrobacteraceae bacterium]|nr:hypothetical protein [Solirubrobacteraceae bacterium]